MADAGIVRNRAKIDATIANARAVLALHDAGRTLDDVLRSHTPPPRPRPRTFTDVTGPSASLALLATAQDLRAQSAALVHDGFVSEVGADRPPQLVRYLRAARHRLVKAAENPQRDADLAWQVQDVEDLYVAARERARR